MTDRRIQPEHPHNHAACLGKAMTAAEAICARRGLRLTKTRRRVLELIWSDHRAVKAYDILERLSQPDHTVRPPTVYRALEFLLEHGFVHRIESLNAYVGCALPDDRHMGQFLICTDCSTVIELAGDAVTSLVCEEAENKGFQVARQMIEVEGLCSRCLEHRPSAVSA